jgi:CheY-like chemotaxis protein/AraC-like DNA-binding protein
MIDEGFDIAVADDEEWVRRGLVSKLSKSGLPFRTIREFAEGGSFLQCIEGGKHFDILLCDIRMPGVDGLSLTAQVRTRLPDLQVIIVSGYGEFEYAKRAIQAGVSEYLLKPVDNVELFMSLKSCMEAITISRRNSEHLNYLQMIERENRARRRLGGGESAGDSAESLALGELFPSYGKASTQFICACFRCPRLKEEDLHDRINRMEEQYLEKAGVENSVFYSWAPEEYVLLFLALEPLDRIREFADAAAQKIQEGRCGIFGTGVLHTTDAAIQTTGVAAGLSAVRDNPEQAVTEALTLMKYRVLMQSPALICAADVSGRNDSWTIPGHHISALRHSLSEGDERALGAVLETIEAEMAGLQLSYRCLENAYLQLLIPVNEARPSAGGESVLFIRDAYKFGSLKALFVFVKDTYIAGIKITDPAAVRGKAGLIRNIAADIDEHFNEYLTLENFAAGYSINTSYLSLLFKEVMGVHFQEYIAAVRIRKAKEYLASGRYKIAEVAEKTGYSNRFYFSRAFKKIEGLSPSEFMNMAVK